MTGPSPADPPGANGEPTQAALAAIIAASESPELAAFLATQEDGLRLTARP